MFMFVGVTLNSTITHSGCRTGFLMNPSALTASLLRLAKQENDLRVLATLRSHITSSSRAIFAPFWNAGASSASSTIEYMTSLQRKRSRGGWCWWEEENGRLFSKGLRAVHASTCLPAAPTAQASCGA